MKLTGRVTKLESGKSYTDGLERVTIKIAESTAPMYSDFSVPNVDGLKLDTELVIEVREMTLGEHKEAVAHGR